MPSIALAQPQYSCDIKEFGNSGWIPPKIVIIHDETSGQVMVHDGIIYGFNDKKPLPARVDVNNAKRTTYA